MKLYNTLTRTKDELVPISPPRVMFYTCGLTVYSQPHIGNWVGYIYWDVLTRYMAHTGYQVDRVQNITDVGHLVSDDDDGEDKMEKGAQAEGLTAWDIAKKYSDIAEHEAYDLLGLVRPRLVKATSCIDSQIAFVEELERKDYTYSIDDGIYFDTSKLSDYGKLARLDIEGLDAGARVDMRGKRNVTDFALWKRTAPGVKRDMEWDSPWGRGFPGWHLECSAIAKDSLGDSIDIHAGGIDHIPIHHTNEIAQTESLTGKQFASIWIHNNHIKVDGKKMSKSLGNIYTLADIVNKGFTLAAFKVLVLSKHYQTEGNFTWEILESAQNRLNNWLQAACMVHQAVASMKGFDSKPFMARINEALEDDINTPTALTAIDSLSEELTTHGVNTDTQSSVSDLIEFIKSVLGIDLHQPDVTQEAKDILRKRYEARTTKDWSLSDSLRDQLSAMGIGIRDTADGQFWYWV